MTLYGEVHARRPVRLVVFYLPQFHPIPENDAWWGKGFTEWTNVARAGPLFPGHDQPRIPADLGFYDLRVPESRAAQTELARRHGIEAFCYWHYWFLGKRILQRPFEEVLRSGEPDFPFCLAWANETWSRRWLGEEKDILLKQGYSADDDLRHAQLLLPAFADQRNIRLHSRPVFLIYRPADLPEPLRTTETFRRECVTHGLAEPFLLGINAHSTFLDCRQIGFDGNVNFEPALGVLPDYMHDGWKLSKLRRNFRFHIVSPRLKIYAYGQARSLMKQVRPSFPNYPTIFVGWDSTPRRGQHGIIIANSTPELFEEGLKELVEEACVKPPEDRLVFINAWNDWAEGNYLEPDLKNGLAYLEAIERASTPSEDKDSPHA
jgi:hypothetical protein